MWANISVFDPNFAWAAYGDGLTAQIKSQKDALRTKLLVVSILLVEGGSLSFVGKFEHYNFRNVAKFKLYWGSVLGSGGLRRSIVHSPPQLFRFCLFTTSFVVLLFLFNS